MTKQSFWEEGQYFQCPIGIITRWIFPNLVIIRWFIIAKILRTNTSSDRGRSITLRPLQLAKRRYLDRLRPLAKLERGGKTFPNDTWTKTVFCVKWQNGLVETLLQDTNLFSWRIFAKCTWDILHWVDIGHVGTYWTGQNHHIGGRFRWTDFHMSSIGLLVFVLDFRINYFFLNYIVFERFIQKVV